MKISNKVMVGDIPKWCLVLATLAAGAGAAGPRCERGLSWWDRERGECVPCTVCDASLNLVVRAPCELHRDAVCQPLRDVRIWPFNSDSDIEYYEYDEDVGDVTDSDVKWDLQTSTLTLAASGCVVFFLVVLTLSVYHARQWRTLKQALTSDVQDLSAKLKLMEAGETPAEPVASADHHIYCNIHVGKDALLGPPSAKKGKGNVYTQEKHSS